jgi:ribosomal-protein-alanine N-acetyltransferase
MWPRRRKDDNAADSVLSTASEPMITPMSHADLNECWRLDQKCFTDGEAYDRETFRYLLSHKQSVCSKVITPAGQMIAFLVGMIESDGTGHVVALAVTPDYRRRGYGRCLMMSVEERFYDRGVRNVRLEVRTSNHAAQNLYFEMGYKIIRRMPRYYTNGDDGYMMVKTLL